MMSASEDRLERLFLKPGELVLAEGPAVVTTVLGSCVSVALFAPATGHGALCHGVLPTGPVAEAGKYVEQAVQCMLDFFAEQGIERQNLVAKVFGGADMFSLPGKTIASLSIGAQNIRAAMGVLKTAGLEPAAVDVGGGCGRKLVCYTHSGEVLLKRIRRELFLETGHQQAGRLSNRAWIGPCVTGNWQ